MSDSFNDLLTKRFYGKDDVEDGPIQLTIKSISKEQVEFQGKPATNETITRFEETDRSLLMKKTTILQLKELFGTPSNAVGKPVELFYDKSVVFNGAKGGLRLRAPTGKAVNTTDNPF